MYTAYLQHANAIKFKYGNGFSISMIDFYHSTNNSFPFLYKLVLRNVTAKHIL